jgi:hypothetical protein
MEREEERKRNFPEEDARNKREQEEEAQASSCLSVHPRVPPGQKKMRHHRDERTRESCKQHRPCQTSPLVICMCKTPGRLGCWRHGRDKKSGPGSGRVDGGKWYVGEYGTYESTELYYHENPINAGGNTESGRWMNRLWLVVGRDREKRCWH